MIHFIRISDPKAGLDEPRRLNPFSGRYLSETEFELLQAYVDDRITPLVGSLPAGIVKGLEVRVEGNDSNTVFNIQPGVAVGADGQLIRLFYPLRQKWPKFAESIEEELLKKNKNLADGYYFLTLHSIVEEIDSNTDQEPGTRTEPDPLRERRLETMILPGLQLISADTQLMSMPQVRAANRICARFLNESPHNAITGGIPIALVKVVNKNPAWIDTVAGRYLSEPDSPYRTLLAHTVALMEQWMKKNGHGDANASLTDLLEIDYLPAAGPLPAVLLSNPAGDRPDTGNSPKLLFKPVDLQVELAPIPASTVGAAIHRELPRGTVDLVHGLGDRIRLLLAIPDLDYRPDLMDLPQRDIKLEDELFHREEAAAKAWADWWLQWQKLFRDLDEELKTAQAPRLSDRPITPDKCRDGLVKQRLISMYGDKIEFPGSKEIDNKKLQLPELDSTSRRDVLEILIKAKLPPPEPYRSHLSDLHTAENYKETPTPVPDKKEDALLVQHKKMRDRIQELEKTLDESYQLLNEMDDYLNLQRQQLDSITMSFSVLAGGVAGDGSGSSMMRWNGAVTFEPKVTSPEKGESP